MHALLSPMLAFLTLSCELSTVSTLSCDFASAFLSVALSLCSFPSCEPYSEWTLPFTKSA